MSRRRYTHRARCIAGCTETGYFEYGSQREHAAHQQVLRTRPWRCVRHTAPDEVLGSEAPTRTVTLIATPGQGNIADTLFWREENSERLGSGFEHGPGFKAYANDFPAGTRLTVTATIAFPDGTLHETEHETETGETSAIEVPEVCEPWGCDGSGWSHQGTSYKSGEPEKQYAPCGRRCGRPE